MKHPLELKAMARHQRVTEKAQKRNKAALDRAQDKALDKPSDRPVVNRPASFIKGLRITRDPRTGVRERTVTRSRGGSDR